MHGWRDELRRGIGIALAVKLAALVALWALFFSPGHRQQVTPDAIGRQLELPGQSR